MDVDVDVALDCRPGKEYDEDAFLYFLAVERSLADRSDHALRLLLVSIEEFPGRPLSMAKATAARLFDALRLSLRETDVIGWYRQDRVAGAVLRARADPAGSDMSRVIRQRVNEGLRRCLPSAVVRSLRVRLIGMRQPSRSR